MIIRPGWANASLIPSFVWPRLCKSAESGDFFVVAWILSLSFADEGACARRVWVPRACRVGLGQVRSVKYRFSAGLGGVGLESEHTLLTLAAPLLASERRSTVCYLLLGNLGYVKQRPREAA